MSDLEQARSAPPPAPDSSAVRREGLVFLGVLVCSRLLLLACLGRLVHGQELTDDVWMLMGMAESPLEILSGQTYRFGQHPPFLAVLEAIVVTPLRWFLPDFYSLRIAFIVYEGLAAWFFWRAASIMVPDRRARRRLEAVWVLIPMGWMTSTIMVQDEVIACALLAAVLWMVAARRWTAALLLCGIGVVAGKIFLSVPLMALVLTVPTGSLLSRSAIGFAPILITYGWVALAAKLRGAAAPLAGFTPTAEFGVNLWIVLIEAWKLSADQARRLSGAIALGVGMLPAVVVFVRRYRAISAVGTPDRPGEAPGWSGEVGDRPGDAPGGPGEVGDRPGEGRGWPEAALERPGEGRGWSREAGGWPEEARSYAALCAAMLLWVFALFYHVNPEYYVIVLPAVLLCFPGRKALVPISLLFTVPWAINFFFGVRNAIAAGGGVAGKGVFVRIYQAIFPVGPGVMLQVSLWICILANFWVAVLATNRAIRGLSAGTGARG